MDGKKTFDGLSEEVKAKLRACRTQEELRKVLEEEDIELDPEALGGVAGGVTCTTNIRPEKCDSFEIPIQPDCEELCPILDLCLNNSTCPSRRLCIKKFE